MKEFIETTIKNAGATVLERYKKVDVKYSKSHELDVVTEADLASNEVITGAIKSTFPDHGIVSEEDVHYNADSTDTWYIDPLDGTLNFATHVPFFGIMIAYAKDGVLEHAAVYLPFFDELVYASKGHGVTINGKRGECAREKNWKNSYGYFDATISKDNKFIWDGLVAFAEHDMVMFNSIMCTAANMRYLAEGK